MSLEAIKYSLANNPNLDNGTKNKLFDLVQIFNKKLPEINLTNLNNKLTNVKITESSKFLRNGVYFYDSYQNVISFSSELEEDYDIDNLLMKSVIEMSKGDTLKDERLNALNASLTEMLANALVGNDGKSDLEEEVVIANLLNCIVGNDNLFNAYFTNNSELVIKMLQDSEVGFNDSMPSNAYNRPSDEILNSYNRLYQAKKTGVLAPDEFSNLLILCGDLFANKIKQGKVTEDEMDNFMAQMPTSVDYFNYPHENITSAYNTVKEGNDMALASVSKRYSMSGLNHR